MRGHFTRRRLFILLRLPVFFFSLSFLHIERPPLSLSKANSAHQSMAPRDPSGETTNQSSEVDTFSGLFDGPSGQTPPQTPAPISFEPVNIVRSASVPPPEFPPMDSSDTATEREKESPKANEQHEEGYEEDWEQYEDNLEDDLERSRAFAYPTQYGSFNIAPTTSYYVPQASTYPSGTLSGYAAPQAYTYPSGTLSGYASTSWQGAAYASPPQYPQYLGYVHGSQYAQAPPTGTPFMPQYAAPASSYPPSQSVTNPSAQHQTTNATSFGRGRGWSYVPGYNPYIHGHITAEAFNARPLPLSHQTRPVLPLEPLDADLDMMEISQLNQERAWGRCCGSKRVRAKLTIIATSTYPRVFTRSELDTNIVYARWAGGYVEVWPLLLSMWRY